MNLSTYPRETDNWGTDPGDGQLGNRLLRSVLLPPIVSHPHPSVARDHDKAAPYELSKKTPRKPNFESCLGAGSRGFSQTEGEDEELGQRRLGPTLVPGPCGTHRPP